MIVNECCYLSARLSEDHDFFMLLSATVDLYFFTSALLFKYRHVILLLIFLLQMVQHLFIFLTMLLQAQR